MANRYGTEHHEFVVRRNAVSLAPTLAWHYGEPFADSSAIPTYYLAQLARAHITVALNGDGGDESFGGYPRCQTHLAALWYRRLPRMVRRALEAGVASLPSARLSRSRLYDLRRFFSDSSSPDSVRYASWFGFFSGDASELEPSFADVTEGSGLDVLEEAFASGRTLHPVDAAMGTDVSIYLPDDLLVKADIATMAHGLEARSPLLDHSLMEFVARLPVRRKMRRFYKKYLLHKAYRDVLPRDVLSRPKVGFGVPLDRWFREDLADVVRDTLLATGARTQEYVQKSTTVRLIDEHRQGRAAHGHRLWALFMLELWHQVCLVRPSAPVAASALFADVETSGLG